MFVRKRDPRYRSHLAHQARLNQTKAKGSSASSNPQPVSQRAQTNNTSYVEQDWQKVTNDRQHDDLEWAAGEGEDPEEWECVACGKSFKSEAAWDSHERSKKHMKEIEKLKREMVKENEELGLSGEVRDDDDERDYVVEVDGNGVPQPPSTPPEKCQDNDSDIVSARLSNVLEDGVTSEESSKDREQFKVGETERSVTQPPEIISASRELSKREKRKLREARKAQTIETGMSTTQVGPFV